MSHVRASSLLARSYRRRSMHKQSHGSRHMRHGACAQIPSIRPYPPHANHSQRDDAFRRAHTTASHIRRYQATRYATSLTSLSHSKPLRAKVQTRRMYTAPPSPVSDSSSGGLHRYRLPRRERTRIEARPPHLSLDGRVVCASWCRWPSAVACVGELVLRLSAGHL